MNLRAEQTTTRRTLIKGAAVAVAGLAAWEVGAAQPALAAAQQAPSTARAGRMKYGVSATQSRFVDNYPRQVRQLSAECCYVYWPAGANTVWTNGPSSAPGHHDIWLQTKDTTKAEYKAMLRTFPAHRKGRVFLHYFNEPENNVEAGDFTLKQWQDRTDALYEAIDEANLPYVVKSVELMYWTMQCHLKGNFGPKGARRVDNFLRPGVRHVGWSCYAEKKVKNGHEVASIDPVKMPQTIGAFMRKRNLPWSAAATGWALDTQFLRDKQSIRNRANWLRTAAPNLAAAGSKHFMWFDIPWSNGDYQIANDRALLKVWNSLAA